LYYPQEVQVAAPLKTVTITRGKNEHPIGDQTEKETKSTATTLCQPWRKDIVKYQEHYRINEEKLAFITRKVKDSYSLQIFLSSPFDGCEQERKVFMENHFPVIFKKCQDKGIWLSIVDMRWGITDQMGKDNKTILACLNAMDKSDVVLGYFGARYGSSTLLGPSGNWIRGRISIDQQLSRHIYIFLYFYCYF